MNKEKNISLKFQGASQRLNNLIPELMYMAILKGRRFQFISEVRGI